MRDAKAASPKGKETAPARKRSNKDQPDSKQTRAKKAAKQSTAESATQPAESKNASNAPDNTEKENKAGSLQRCS